MIFHFNQTSIDEFLYHPADPLLFLILFINGIIFLIGRFIRRFVSSQLRTNNNNHDILFFSRQKDVLSNREKKMFTAYKHHLETNVDVKQVNINWILNRKSLSHSERISFRKVFTNHFWPKQSIKVIIENFTQIFFLININ